MPSANTKAPPQMSSSLDEAIRSTSSEVLKTTAADPGLTEDLALALHWIEILARLGMLHTSPVAQRILARLLSECDSQGVWSPPGLRSLPKSPSRLAEFAFPLTADGTPEERKADVTFRLAHTAKLAGWALEFT